MHKSVLSHHAFHFYRYKHGTSTGNLISHLRLKHKKEILATNFDSTQQKLTNYFGEAASSIKTKTTSTENKFRLAREMALWFSRDLLAFQTAEKSGFQDFCMHYNIWKPGESLPSSRTLLQYALSDVYHWVLATVKKQLESAPSTICFTFDAWTDNYRRRSYITYTAHWIDQNWCLRYATLRTSLFPHPHSGEAIEKDFRDMCKEFNLCNKAWIATTDNGANRIRACQLLKVLRLPCVAHGLHLLIGTDLFKPNKNCDNDEHLNKLQELLSKMRECHRTLIFKFDDLQTEFDKTKNEKIWNTLENHSNLGKYDTCLYSKFYNQILLTEDMLNADSQFDSDQCDHSYAQSFSNALQASFQTLKRDVSTRWNSILMMLQSFMKNQGK